MMKEQRPSSSRGKSKSAWRHSLPSWQPEQELWPLLERLMQAALVVTMPGIAITHSWLR